MIAHSPVFTDEEKTKLGIIPEEEIEEYINKYYAEKEHILKAAINIYDSYIGEIDEVCICSFCVPEVNPAGLSVTCTGLSFSDSIPVAEETLDDSALSSLHR